jgi:hypothetical protein
MVLQGALLCCNLSYSILFILIPPGRESALDGKRRLDIDLDHLTGTHLQKCSGTALTSHMETGGRRWCAVPHHIAFVDPFRGLRALGDSGNGPRQDVFVIGGSGFIVVGVKVGIPAEAADIVIGGVCRERRRYRPEQPPWR